MNSNFVWAVLVAKKIISQEEAEALSKELNLAIHSTDFKTAEVIVKNILDKVGQIV